MYESKVLKKPNFFDFRLASTVVHRRTLNMKEDGIRLPYTRTRIIFCFDTCKINHKLYLFIIMYWKFGLFKTIRIYFELILYSLRYKHISR